MGLRGLIKNKKGSATVYLLISFTVLLVAAGVLTDLARIKAAQYQLKRSVNSAARSVMAHYNPDLRSAYGLYGRAEPGAKEEFAGYLTGNLNIYPEDFILAVRYENSNIKMAPSLEQREILKGQILEDMKYKGPVDFFLKLADCFRKISGLTVFFENSNDMRRSVALINRFMAELNEIHGKTEAQLVTLVQNRKRIQSLEEQLRQALPERAGEIHQEISELKQGCQKTENQIQTEFQRADRLVIELELEINQLDAKFISAQRDGNRAEASDKLPIRQDMVYGQFDEAIKAYQKDIASIGAQLENAKGQFEKLKENQNSLDVSGIGIEAAAQAHQRITQAEKAGLPQADQKTLLQEISRLKALHGELEIENEPDGKGQLTETESAGEQGDSISEIFDMLFKKLDDQPDIYSLRDELYIDQYILTRFTNLTTGSVNSEINPYSGHEAEYICYGNNGAVTAVAQLYFTRFALDTAAYFAFTKEPVELLQRMLYALVMGGLQAVADTYQLVAEKKAVPIGNMFSENPLGDITLNYTDHLRLLFFLRQDEEGKLFRMTEIMVKKSGVDPKALFSGIYSDAAASIKLWFLPALGFGNMEKGPFGTTVRKGVCYITKGTSYTY